jgi:hypothetical protein
VTPGFPFWPALFASPCLGHEPKARVATISTKYLVVRSHYVSFCKVSGLFIILISLRRIVHYVPIICIEKSHSIILKRSYKSDLSNLQN